MAEPEMADLLLLEEDDDDLLAAELVSDGRPLNEPTVSRVCLLCGDRGPTVHCPRCGSQRLIENVG